VGVRWERALPLGVPIGEGVIDFASSSSSITNSSSSIRAAAATGFATGKKIVLGRAHLDTDVLDTRDTLFVYISRSDGGVLVERASRIVDFIIVGKWKRLSLLLLLRWAGQDSRRRASDVFVSNVFADVGVRCWIDGRADEGGEEGEWNQSWSGNCETRDWLIDKRRLSGGPLIRSAAVCDAETARGRISVELALDTEGVYGVGGGGGDGGDDDVESSFKEDDTGCTERGGGGENNIIQ
jgi:hypothetical protein